MNGGYFYEYFFFGGGGGIGNKNFIKRTEHRVHDGQETNTDSSRTKANRL